MRPGEFAELNEAGPYPGRDIGGEHAHRTH